MLKRLSDYVRMQLSEHLQTWRKERGLTREKAAALIGVTASTWFRWETGKKPGPLGMLALTKAGVITP